MRLYISQPVAVSALCSIRRVKCYKLNMKQTKALQPLKQTEYETNVLNKLLSQKSKAVHTVAGAAIDLVRRSRTPCGSQMSEHLYTSVHRDRERS